VKKFKKLFLLVALCHVAFRRQRGGNYLLQGADGSEYIRPPHSLKTIYQEEILPEVEVEWAICAGILLRSSTSTSLLKSSKLGTEFFHFCVKELTIPIRSKSSDVSVGQVLYSRVVQNVGRSCIGFMFEEI
jgi:hypothetical protein